MIKHPGISITLLICVGLISSCAKRDNTPPANLAKNKLAAVYNKDITEEKLLQQGWKLVNTVKLNSGKTTKPNISESIPELSQSIAVDESVLQGMGYDVNSSAGRIDLFNDLTNEGDARTNGVRFYENYGIWSYHANHDIKESNASVSMGKLSLGTSVTTKLPAAIIRDSVFNYGNDPVTSHIKYSVKTGYKTSASHAWKYEGKFGYKAKVGLFVEAAEISVEVTVGYTHGAAEENSTETTVERWIDVTIPPHSKVACAIFVNSSTAEATYHAPFAFTGNIIVDKSVWDSWVRDINTFPKFTTKSPGITGKIKATMYTDAKEYVSPAEPI